MTTPGEARRDRGPGDGARPAGDRPAGERPVGARPHDVVPEDARPAERTWTIAEMAEDFAVTHRTIRHYEDLGLLSPERRGTHRVYRRRDRTRLTLILRGKRLGFPLEEIRTIVDLYDDARGPRAQLEYVLGQIGDRRADLESRLRDIQESLAELDAFEARCRTELEGRAG